MAPTKIYELQFGIVYGEVKRALGMRTHHSQADVYVVADSKDEAAKLLGAAAVVHGCDPRSLRLAGGNMFDMLRNAGVFEQHRVVVGPSMLSVGRRVVAVSGAGEVTVIGQIAWDGDGVNRALTFAPGTPGTAEDAPRTVSVHTTESRPGEVMVYLTHPSDNTDHRRLVALRVVDETSGQTVVQLRMDAEQFTTLMGGGACVVAGATFAKRPELVGKVHQSARVFTGGRNAEDAAEAELARDAALAAGWDVARAERTNDGVRVTASRWLDPADVPDDMYGSTREEEIAPEK